MLGVQVRRPDQHIVPGLDLEPIDDGVVILADCVRDPLAQRMKHLVEFVVALLDNIDAQWLLPRQSVELLSTLRRVGKKPVPASFHPKAHVTFSQLAPPLRSLCCGSPPPSRNPNRPG